MDPIRKLSLWALSLSLSTLMLSACGGDSDKESSVRADGITAKVQLELHYSDVPLMDSLVIDCLGADTLHLVKNPEDHSLELDLFPHDHWEFQAKIYANGSLMQRGEAEARLEAGKTTEISIKMHPLAGFIYLKIPLGFGNPANIAYGQMELESSDSLYTYLMEIDDSEGIFRTDLLPLETSYRLKITLYDNLDNNIYQVEDSLYLSPDNPVPSLELKSLRGKASIAIEIADNANLEIRMSLPATRRAPKQNDLVITEFLSAPLKTDSSQYEFIEIYNGSTDTLALNGCTIGTGSAGNKAWEILKSEIAPGSILVFGDTSVNTPDVFRNTATWGDLTNTKSSIVLQCNGTVLDSLFYSNIQDSTTIIPNNSNPSKNPQSSQLDIRYWQNRGTGDSWCMGTPSPNLLKDCL
ncbi:MAG: lamin tail domain-containing protein [Fibrobacter sp.]|nr:lamin tail domain-containing protein [Fibrobacter sp.]